MNSFIRSIAIAACITTTTVAEAEPRPTMTAPSAQVEAPPTEAKRLLIRRFMKASGLQERLDSGSFLEKYALRSDLDWHRGKQATTVLDLIRGPIDALKTVYQRCRLEYQNAYGDHINWEFTEEELQQIVNFLESPVGQHYLDGTWRMEAYTNTNMEETEAALVNEAVTAYRRK